jgi:hypothetical protein
MDAMMVARPCLDVLLLASRLALEHKGGLAELVTAMVVRGEGSREEGEGVVALESLRALVGAVVEVVEAVGQAGGEGVGASGAASAGAVEAPWGQSSKRRKVCKAYQTWVL